MDSNGKQKLISASPREIELLERKLVPGQSFPFLLVLGADFRPVEAVVYLRRTPTGFQLRTATPLKYMGDSIVLWSFASRGWHDAANLVELISFLREKFSDRPTPTPAMYRPDAPSGFGPGTNFDLNLEGLPVSGN